MMRANATVKVIHKIQHRHIELAEWVTENCKTEELASKAWELVRFIIDRFPETADSLNGELEEWES